MKAFKIASTTLFLLLLFAASCTSPSFTQTIQTQYDNATGTKNFRWNHRLHEFRWRSPLVYIDQSFVKQLDGDEVAQYRLYDIVVLRANEFRLEDKMFMLLDEKPVALQPRTREDDVMVSRDVDRDDILTADSTKISVVTGYNENNYRVTRLEYALSPEVVSQILTAASIQFRYYSGSNIITVSFSPEKVLRLKELLSST
ncbi:MAG: hypothetical protein KF803_07595 [Cyclobacteriaceae bacterium]|nr:hypothetical protein [Cyclobacteriaceae bacterium]